MKKFKKLFLVILSVMVTFTISSCNKDTRNITNVPYGSITDSQVFATAGSYSVSNLEVYNKLRVSGYGYVLNHVKEALFADEINAVDYVNNEDDHNDINDLVFSEMLSTTVAKTAKKYTAKQIEQYKLKYIDQMAKDGVTVVLNDLSYSIENDKFVADFPEHIVNNYKLQVAQKRAAVASLNELTLKEKVENDNGDLVANTYYISDYSIKNEYNNYYKEYNDTQAIIIRFNSRKDAYKIYDNAVTALGELTEESSQEEILNFYLHMYNEYYSYRETLTTYNYTESSYTNFTQNDKNTDIANISTNFKEYYYDSLADGEFNYSPYNLNNKYIMVYRINTNYITETSEPVEYADLDGASGSATNKEEIYAKLFKKLVDKKATSSYYDKLFLERLEESTVEIYDPYLEYQFESVYSDYYDFTSNISSNDVIKIVYNDKTTIITVDSFFNELAYTIGNETATNLLVNKWLLDSNNNYLDLIDSDDMDTAYSALKDSIKTFNKGKDSTYAKEIGLQTFLMSKFGYTTQDDVEKHYITAAAVKKAFLSNHENLSLFDNESHQYVGGENTLFENFLVYVQKAYNSLFTINITHFLIYVDDNCDGTIDDPKEFMEKLSANELVEYKAAVEALSKAVIAESEYITTDKLDAFKYIAKAYNEGLALNHPDYQGYTWNDFKTKFNFQVTVEELGDISDSNKSNYVEEFSIYVENLYREVVTFDTDDQEDYLEFADLSFTYDDICLTQFGYHLMYVNSITEPNSAKQLASDDIDSNNDGINDYEKIKVIIKADTDDDDTVDSSIYIYVDAYSESDIPSINQLLIYFYESQTSDGVVSLKSTVETAVANAFTSIISRYTSSSFQEYRLISKLGEITFTNDTYNTLQSNYIGSLERSINSYSTSTDPVFDGWFNTKW